MVEDVPLYARPRRARALTGRLAGRVGAMLYPLLAVVAALALWQLVVSLSGVSSYVVPSPIDVVNAAADIGGVVLRETPPTLLEIVGGFLIAAVTGIPLGVMLATFRRFESAVFPLLIGTQGIPKVALAPIFVVWFGFGYTPKIVMALLIAFFPIVIDTIAGVRSVNPAYVALGRSMLGTRWRIYRRIILPNALPQIFAGLKVAMSLAIIGAIVGELVGSSRGLGHVLQSASGQLQMDRAFVVIVWLMVISVPLVQAVSWLERLVVPWAPHSRAAADGPRSRSGTA